MMGVHLHHKKLAWVLAIILSLCTTLTSGISYKSHFSFIGTKINESSFSKALTIFSRIHLLCKKTSMEELGQAQPSGGLDRVSKQEDIAYQAP